MARSFNRHFDIKLQASFNPPSLMLLKIFHSADLYATCSTYTHTHIYSNTGTHTRLTIDRLACPRRKVAVDIDTYFANKNSFRLRSVKYKNTIRI